MLQHYDLWLTVVAVVLFLLSQCFRIARYFLCLGKFSISTNAIVAFHLLGSFLCYLGLPILTYELVMMGAFLLYRPQSFFPAGYSLVLLRLTDVFVVLGGICLIGGPDRKLVAVLMGLAFLGLAILRLLPAMLLRLEIKALQAENVLVSVSSQVKIIDFCARRLAEIKDLSWNKHGTVGSVVLLTCLAWGSELLALGVLTPCMAVAFQILEGRINSLMLEMTNGLNSGLTTFVYLPLKWSLGVAAVVAIASCLFKKFSGVRNEGRY